MPPEFSPRRKRSGIVACLRSSPRPGAASRRASALLCPTRFHGNWQSPGRARVDSVLRAPFRGFSRVKRHREGTAGRTALSDGNAPPMRAIRRQEKPPTGEIPRWNQPRRRKFPLHRESSRKTNPGSARESRNPRAATAGVFNAKGRSPEILRNFLDRLRHAFGASQLRPKNAGSGVQAATSHIQLFASAARSIRLNSLSATPVSAAAYSGPTFS